MEMLRGRIGWGLVGFLFFYLFFLSAFITCGDETSTIQSPSPEIQKEREKKPQPLESVFFSSSGDEEPIKVFKFEDKFVLFGRGGGDTLILHIDAIGKLLKATLLGSREKYESISDVMRTSDGGFVLVGITSEKPLMQYFDIFVAKLDKDGKYLWSKIIGGTDHDAPVKVIETSDGNILVIGFTSSFGDYNIWLIKLDGSGNIIWQKIYGEEVGWDRAMSAVPTSDGGFVVVGWSGTFSQYTEGGDDIFIMKFDKDGNVQWVRLYGTPQHDGANAVIETQDNNLLVVGLTRKPGNQETDLWLIKLSETGDLIWHKIYDISGSSEYPISALELLNGNFLIVGFQDNYILSIEVNSSDGNVIWARRYSVGLNGVGVSAIQMEDGQLILVGSAIAPYGKGMGGKDIWITKLTPDGHLPICSGIESDLKIQVVEPQEFKPYTKPLDFIKATDVPAVDVTFVQKEFPNITSSTLCK